MRRLQPLFLSCLFLLAACGKAPRTQFGEQLDLAYDRFAEEASPEGMSHTELTARLRTDLAALDASVLPEEEQEAFQLIQKNAEEFEAVLAVALAAGEDVDKPPLQWQDPELGRKLMDLMGDMMMGILDLGVEIQGESFLD